MRPLHRKSISDQGFARPAPAYFPYRDHRTMAEVMADERAVGDRELPETMERASRRLLQAMQEEVA